VLVERYQRKVYAIAYAMLRDREDALDVVQESFIKVHRHLASFEAKSSFYTWLYRIVTNLCLDLLRRRGRGREAPYDDGSVHGTEGSGVFSDGDPAAVLRRREILQAVQESLHELSDKHRSVIVMRELQGMSYGEMAAVAGCSKGTIMSRLFHARRNMQRLLRARLGHEPDARPAPAGEEPLAPVDVVVS
jgi:RNA polymerase sigma-70 factor (ECF subfamily)